MTISPTRPSLEPRRQRGSVIVLDGSGALPAVVGGKAAALDRLIGWGVRVPPCAVVTVEAFREVARAPTVARVLARLRAADVVPAAEVDAAFVEAGLPAHLTSDIVAAIGAIKTAGLLAVRSSATTEDLEGSSFAGQYLSLLNVDSDDADALAHAVVRTMASLLHPAPCAYRIASGLGAATGAMAVLLMPMVPALRAGVVFTEDPTVAPGTLRIEVVDGLGDALVSGRRTPRVIQLDPMAANDDQPPELAELARLCLDIARRCEHPQDIEWAWDGSLTWILQARPITVPPAEGDAFDDPRRVLDGADLTTSGVGEMLPGVVPPLIWQLSSHLVEEAFRSMFDDLGVMPADLVAARGLIRRVRGRAALDAGRLSAALAAIPGAATRLHSEYFEAPATDHTDGSGGRPRRVVVMRHRRRATRAWRRATFDADVIIHAADGIAARRKDIGPWTGAELWRYHDALVDLAVRGSAAELLVATEAVAIHDGLQSLLARHLPADVAGRFADALTVPPAANAPSPASSAAIFAGPTWFERGIVTQDTLTAAPREQTLDRAWNDLQTVPGWPSAGWAGVLRQRRLERLAAQAADQFERRDRTKSALFAIGGEVRRIHLEIGRRLSDAGRLVHPTDVELLTIEELRRCSVGVAIDRSAIERRRRWCDRHEAEGPLPLRFTGIPGPVVERCATPDRQLVGWAGSGGTFAGIARRVDGADGTIEPTEVLLATATDPSWSPLLIRCGAMVIERGGPLSHAAIVAREFGVPAVFNVPGAASMLDGRRVLVDGDAGVVTVLEDPTS